MTWNLLRGTETRAAQEAAAKVKRGTCELACFAKRHDLQEENMTNEPRCPHTFLTQAAA